MQRDFQAQPEAPLQRKRFLVRAMRGTGPRLQPRSHQNIWLIITCDGCGTVIDLDLSVKPRDSEASI